MKKGIDELIYKSLKNKLIIEWNLNERHVFFAWSHLINFIINVT